MINVEISDDEIKEAVLLKVRDIVSEHGAYHVRLTYPEIIAKEAEAVVKAEITAQVPHIKLLIMEELRKQIRDGVKETLKQQTLV